jgi:DNA-binding NtrC family response regulator
MTTPPTTVAPTVLVVEDEEGVRRLVVTMLTMSGFVVLQAGSAAEALERARAHTGPLHVLLADLSLPDGPGDVLAPQVQALHPGMPVVFTSGYPDAEAAGLPAGTPFIRKPFTRAALVDRLRDAVAGI